MFIRVVTPSLWAPLLSDDPSADAVEAIVRQWMLDMPLSLYRCDTEQDIELTAVAMSTRRNADRKFDYLRVTTSDLGPLLDAFPPAANDETPVAVVNSRHHEGTITEVQTRDLVLRCASRARSERRERISDSIKGKDLRRIAKILNDTLALGLPHCWLLE